MNTTKVHCNESACTDYNNTHIYRFISDGQQSPLETARVFNKPEHLKKAACNSNVTNPIEKYVQKYRLVCKTLAYSAEFTGMYEAV